MVKKMTECITTWESILDSYFVKPDNFLKSDPSFLSFGSLLLLQWSYHIETQFLENSNATKIRKIHCITLHHRVILRHGILFVENEILKWYQKSPTPGDVYDIGSEMINRFCCNSLVANANIWLSILVSVNRVTKSQVQRSIVTRIDRYVKGPNEWSKANFYYISYVDLIPVIFERLISREAGFSEHESNFKNQLFFKISFSGYKNGIWTHEN